MTRTRWAATALTVAVAALALTGCGSPDVTRPRLEHAIAPTFANLYARRAALLGEHGITTTTIDARASCDRGGPKVRDIGPGADWICQITYHDDHGQTQTGKFEVQAKADATYVASGPTKLVGQATITDKAGNDVPNPVFEFDGAFNPNS